MAFTFSPITSFGQGGRGRLKSEAKEEDLRRRKSEREEW
jgi:hypothetical protein